MNNYELHEAAQQLVDTNTAYQLAKELILLREECDQLKAVISEVCDKCTETGNSEIFQIAASKNISLNKIKADALREANNDILGYAGLSEFYKAFEDRADKIERGEV